MTVIIALAGSPRNIPTISSFWAILDPTLPWQASHCIPELLPKLPVAHFSGMGSLEGLICSRMRSFSYPGKCPTCYHHLQTMLAGQGSKGLLENFSSCKVTRYLNMMSRCFEKPKVYHRTVAGLVWSNLHRKHSKTHGTALKECWATPGKVNEKLKGQHLSGGTQYLAGFSVLKLLY